MKRIAFLFIGITIVLASLQNCKPEPIDQPDPGDPDSLYVNTKYTITVPYNFPQPTNPYKDSLSYEGIELGRRLFYDKRLSSTGQMACASCHKPEFAFSDGLKLSNNVFGSTARNTPSLQNLLWDPNFFWDGRATTLHAQAKDAMAGEQGLIVADAITYLQNDSTYASLFRKAFGRPGKVTEDGMYKALQQFMMIMISSDSKFDKFLKGQAVLTPSEIHGFDLMRNEAGDCVHCHFQDGNALFIFPSFTNNGLDSALTVDDFVDKGRGGITGNTNEYGRFKNPTIRNVALSAPYMHDGRFNTLEEVIEFYSTGKQLSPTIDVNMLKPNHANGGLNLSDEDKQALLDFLHTLTDTTFTNNPMLQDPF
jgi:cytochrome c peroxidase